MQIFWRIRFLDSVTKTFADRDLYLDTNCLGPDLASAVKVTVKLSSSNRRDMLRFRQLFSTSKTVSSFSECGSDFYAFCIPDYVEDENGIELNHQDIGTILSGDQNVRFMNPSMRPHDIVFALSSCPHLNCKDLVIRQVELTNLGYFKRDLHEITTSEFWMNGPGTISTTGIPGKLELRTATKTEEIRSFVMSFRRLYMENERANFLKAVKLFSRAEHGHPISEWIISERKLYQQYLVSTPEFIPGLGCSSINAANFTVKKVIDSFLNTQFAHQPDQASELDYNQCLVSANNDQHLLMWYFLNSIWRCSIFYQNAGSVIVQLHDQYIKHFRPSSNIIDSLQVQPLLGSLEKREAERNRVIREHSISLAHELWVSAGCPAGGHFSFICEAEKQIIELTK